MNSAGRSNISSIFQHGLQDGYLSLNPHAKGGLFPLMLKGVKVRTPKYILLVIYDIYSSFIHKYNP